ncbi:hypothetical protein K445DRAFT_316164 [Daldinia sp. EC12]|nr:hypothetical protein K445DRAFT_316164 [Daldinia sp. EC12]
MDFKGNFAAQDGNKYNSKFFPPNPAVFNLTNHVNREPLLRLVQQTILYHVRNGHTLIELWKDAYDTKYVESETEPYSLYLTAARKTIGRMIHFDFGKRSGGKRQLDFSALEALAKELPRTDTKTEVRAKMDSPSPINPVEPRFSLLAPEFSPEKPVGDKTIAEPDIKEEDTPSEDATTDPRLVSFEERYKRLGVRIASERQ